MRSSLVLLTFLAGACTPSDAPQAESAPEDASSQEAAPSPSPAPVSVSIECDTAFRDAAAVDAMHDTLEDLDPALRACKSVEEWVAASNNHPGAIDVDPVVFLRNRCEFGGPDTELCRRVKETE